MPVLQPAGETRILHIKLIQCPRQPGKLRISEEACALRYLKAQKTGRRTSAKRFGMPDRESLELCRTCPKGRLNAKKMSR